ncbi:trypsin-like peptidase domain-containing protein [Candidatus Berkiella cookevillensis]|uniref:Serine protease Do-like HtrA n=1 Tax=Candidatus Berkiella cookevillensis TaxID=437022 RepID=A0A0Q9YT58_9GAMM|nr:S1C family serine protease [Candidatus Berkiella cookevillensis]MCS5708393.1 trypsin-like peptidase domain-containing protein [Candidatus Berkiella cookevillensis]
MPKTKKNHKRNGQPPIFSSDVSSDEEVFVLSDIENESESSELELSPSEDNSDIHNHGDIDNYSKSVFKVMVKTKDYDYDNPWHPPIQNSHSGSGFAVSYLGQTFLVTNAHVASKIGRMEVRLSDDSEEYKAEALLIENDCDLAIIKVDSPEFTAQIKALELGDMLKMQQKLTVHGFPIGGEELCITEGKVSRIEVGTYVQAGTNLLQAQVSAEINPGNSGGPAISGGKVVGVAFQGDSRGDGLGFIIPTPIIEHLLKEALDLKNYKGFPDLNFKYQILKNDNLRAHFGLAEKEAGIRVKSVPKLSAARNILKPNDIILAIDGHKVKNDGTIETDFNKRLNLDYLISSHFIGDAVKIDLLRNNERISVDILLQNRFQTTKKVQHRYEEAPTYFFISGIALCPLTDNLLEDSNVGENLFKYAAKEKRKPGQEVVIIKSILACDHNQGYEHHEEEVVKRINGKRISNMREAIEATESHTGKNHLIETYNGHVIAVPNLSQHAHKRILKDFDIRQDRSKDLKKDPVYKPGCPEARSFLPSFSLSKAKAHVVDEKSESHHLSLKKRMRA